MRICANTVLKCSCAPVFNNTCAPKQPRYLPDSCAGASSERRPLLCTANPCASPLHQQVTELPKSLGVKSCSTRKLASSGPGEPRGRARNALYNTGAGSGFGPRAPQGSRQGHVRLAGCDPHSQEMTPAPRNSWFGRRTVELWWFQDAASLHYYN